MLHCFAFEEKGMEWIDWHRSGQESSEFEDEFSQTRWEWCGPADMGIPNKNELTKAHALAQLSLQAQQNVKAQIEEILM